MKDKPGMPLSDVLKMTGTPRYQLYEPGYPSSFLSLHQLLPQFYPHDYGDLAQSYQDLDFALYFLAILYFHLSLPGDYFSTDLTLTQWLFLLYRPCPLRHSAVY